MNRLQKELYSATATATGGRSGTAESDDGRLRLSLSTPKALGGDDGQGTNPEQLFAAGYSACFIGAMRLVAGQMKLPVNDSVNVTARVAIGPIEQGFGIAVKLLADLPDITRDKAMELLEAAHQVCPYSNATRGNIEVELNLK